MFAPIIAAPLAGVDCGDLGVAVGLFLFCYTRNGGGHRVVSAGTKPSLLRADLFPKAELADINAGVKVLIIAYGKYILIAERFAPGWIKSFG